MDLLRPIFTCVGRVSSEKNLEAFFDLDLPGSKVIVGDGPQFRKYGVSGAGCQTAFE